MAHYYFGIWDKNFSITPEEKNILYAAYDRYLQSRLARDSAYIEFKFNAKAKLLDIKSGFSNDHISNTIRDKVTYSYAEILPVNNKLEIISEKSKYLELMNKQDIE